MTERKDKRALWRIAGRLWLLACAFVVTGSMDIDEVRLPSGSEVPVPITLAEGDVRVLWLPSENGYPGGMQRLAHELGRKGVEVWWADLFGAYFLPQLPSSLGKIPDADLAALLDHVLSLKDKRVVLMADGRGAQLVVRAVAQWQKEHKQDWPKRLLGTVLVSPNLYIKTPEAGSEAQYIAQSGALRGPVTIVQPNLSPWFWWLERTGQALGQQGARVTVQRYIGVRDRFYYRPDAMAREQQQAKRLAGDIAATIRNMDKGKFK